MLFLNAIPQGPNNQNTGIRTETSPPLRTYGMVNIVVMLFKSGAALCKSKMFARRHRCAPCASPASTDDRSNP